MTTRQPITAPAQPRARKPLPPPLPPMPPSPELLASLVEDTGLPLALVRRWLDGGTVRPDVRDMLRAALWAPLQEKAT